MPGTTDAYTVTAFDRHGQSAPVGPIIALVLGAPGPTPTVAVPAALPTFAAPPSPNLHGPRAVVQAGAHAAGRRAPSRGGA
jgi:hypothetical protein